MIYPQRRKCRGWRVVASGDFAISLASQDLPWLAGWNYRLLQILFHVLPHSATIDTFFEFLESNRLVTTWIFAACFYWFWSKEDQKTTWRRQQLFQLIVATAIAVLLTLAIRPWMGWPAPARDPTFRALYPQYFWHNGTLNSFPSHATLVYFAVAAGLWTFNRSLSLGLALLALGIVSVPRIYLGGHYPIDVAASMLLAIFALTLIRHWRLPVAIAERLDARGPGTAVREFLLILWIFELGEGFRGTMSILINVNRLLFR
jgi:undecaprenyl-diphosphatase